MSKNDKHRTGRVFVVSSPSGGGKTTIAKALLKKTRGMVRSISMTTRKKRKGERVNRDYFFVTKPEFEKKIKQKSFLEHAKVFTEYYGTPKSFVGDKCKQGKDVLLLIDVQGAKQVKKNCKDAVLIFIMPPSLRELEKRLRGRNTDTMDEIKRRLKVAKEEIQQKNKYDYVIINRHLTKAVAELKKIILLERMA